MEKIVVSIRVRPLSKQESAKGSAWKVSSNAISLCNAASGAVLPGHTYIFDSVFGTEDKTVELYDAHTKAIISSAVKGINGTVFAYGQTSSGKTFTMRGSSAEPGIIPMSVRDVFANIQQAEDREFLLRVSYMEIYNEEINDLLAPENRKLQVHENLERGIFVAGLREEIVSCPEQVLQLLDFGEAHRHVGETNMNVYSSRSHTIFRMVIESRDRSQDDALQTCDAVRVSVLNLVDLAGSERVAKTGAEGARLKEGSHINKSLMTLGTVINKLSEGIESQGGHVPYRDSKLTRILQPALGGNARTVIICNVTPAMVHVDETKGTLQFASRAIRVTNCAQVNEIVTDAALLKRQKREIEELRSKLQESHSEHLEEEVLNLRNAMLKIELERERMALELQNKAERERRMKEQIENLSTMVLNSAVDDRHAEKSSKKSNRRETWCPRLTSSEPAVKFHVVKPNVSLVSSRERTLPLPPPFEALKEEDEVTMNDSKEVTGDEFGGNEMVAPPPVSSFVGDRRNKLSARLHAKEEELLDLQARYQALHCDYEVANSEIDKLRNENEQLKSTAYKSGAKHSDGDRRCKSLDGSQPDIPAELVEELQSQVQTFEVEKYYMQRELDSRIEHAKMQANSAKQLLEGLHEELKESNQQIEQLTTRNMLLERENDEAGRSFLQLATAFEDLNAEVEVAMSHAASCVQELMIGIEEPVMCFEELRLLRKELYENLTIEKTKLEQKLALAEASRSQLDELQQVQVNLSQQLQQRNASLQMQEEAKQDLVTELTDVYYKLEEEKAVSNARRITIEEKESECNSLNVKIQALSSQNTVLENTMRSHLKKLEETLEAKEDRLENALNQMTEKLGGELVLILQKTVEAENDIQKEIQSRLEDGHVVQELRAITLELEVNAESYKQQIAELESVKKNIEEKLNTSKELSAATAASQSEKIMKLTDELHSKHHKIEELMDELNCEQRKVENLSKELDCEHHKFESLTEELNSEQRRFKTVTEELQRECQTMQEECLRLQASERDETCERTSQLELQQKQLEEKVRSGEKEIQTLLTSKTKFQVAFDAVSAKAEVFEMRLEDARWDLIEFKDKAKRVQDKLESNLAAAKLEIVELKVELETVNNQLTSFQEEHQTLKDCSKRKPAELHSGSSKVKKLKDSDQEKLSSNEGSGTPRSRASRKSPLRSPLSPLDNLQSRV